MSRILVAVALSIVLAILPSESSAQTLQVKDDKHAIVKHAPAGDSETFDERLPPGETVTQVGSAPRYYQIELDDGRVGWSWKGNFIVVEPAVLETGMDLDSLTTRTNLLEIIIIDVEVGDATLIICPEEDGRRDVILIDTGENDSDRIRQEMLDQGLSLDGRPIDAMFISHYDFDHMGDAIALFPLVNRLYDRGDVQQPKPWYTVEADRQLHHNRETVTLEFHEQYTGGVEIECVAVNNQTDDDRTRTVSTKENDNSIALIVTLGDFDYFTGGDLTKTCERSLATTVRDCDVYHVNHHGSRATSSIPDFVERLSPEVSIASNGTAHGHPTRDVAQRLIDLDSMFYQTNFNPDTRANNADDPNSKFVADDTFNPDEEDEDLEGALGTIRLVVDPVNEMYFVLMEGLPFDEAAFPFEDN